MPWEKSFDEETALEKAMQVFWDKGYESASIADLIEGTGLNRGSLYNAFGGKRDLFLKTLTKYDRETRQAWLAELEALDDPRQALSRFFDGVVEQTIADPDHKGCFLVNTSLEFPAHDEEVRQFVAKGLRELEGFFRRCIEVGQARGEIRATLEPQVGAKTLVALLVGIRVLGRGVGDESTLQAVADEAKRLID
ncbi:TetR/AcrR family transcriptional regulator [Elongatibacter sediminis]|uniref:TetR/AcrR family transcriptional regulator n=1 Tax=Elongatibacter sediminis TaxID=3119006 RepID=A0AAW9RB61_9GAMM